MDDIENMMISSMKAARWLFNFSLADAGGFRDDELLFTTKQHKQQHTDSATKFPILQIQL